MSQGRMENRLCQDVPGAPDRLNERLGSLWDVRFIEGRPKTRACCARRSTSTTRCCNAVWVSACVARSRAMAAPASASRAQRCEIIGQLRDHDLRLLVQTRGQLGAIPRMIRTRPTARYKAMDTPTSAR